MCLISATWNRELWNKSDIILFFKNLVIWCEWWWFIFHKYIHIMVLSLCNISFLNDSVASLIISDTVTLTFSCSDCSQWCSFSDPYIEIWHFLSAEWTKTWNPNIKPSCSLCTFPQHIFVPHLLSWRIWVREIKSLKMWTDKNAIVDTSTVVCIIHSDTCDGIKTTTSCQRPGMDIFY